jgi:predicted phage terminase large subunit-like protein
MNPVAQELLRRKRALESMASFREYLEPSGHVDFQFPHEKHHTVMVEAFERVMAGDLKRLMILMPPASAKSTLCIQFVMWWLARYPYHNILRVSATQSLSEKFARRCRSALSENAFHLLSGATLSPTEQSVSNFGTTQGGGITSAGVGTSIIGLRSNLNILDDPVSGFEQANSETQRQTQIDWYFAEYRSRLVPDSPEIIVSTRWHSGDICGHLLKSPEADTWEVIRIPMECDSPDDPLGRKFGERLWPEWFTEQSILENKRDPERWAGMFQQTPFQSEGDFLDADDFELVDSAPDDLGLYCSVDLALSSRESADATVILIAGMSSDGKIYVLDMYKHRCPPNETLERLQNLYDQHKFREVLIENSPAEKTFRDLAHSVFLKTRRQIPLIEMPTRGRDKMARAQSIRSHAKMGGLKLVRGSWNSDLIRECTEFPVGRHDDIVDALALLGQRAPKMGSLTVHSPTLRPEIQGAITQDEHGQMATRSTLDQMWEDRPKRHGTLRI